MPSSRLPGHRPDRPGRATTPTRRIRLRLDTALHPYGLPYIDVRVPSDVTAGELRQLATAIRPELRELLADALVVAGDRVLADGAPLPHGCEVTLLVPMVGEAPPAATPHA